MIIKNKELTRNVLNNTGKVPGEMGNILMREKCQTSY
jgi:hypothetical protein